MTMSNGKSTIEFTGHRWAGWQAAITSKQKELDQANATIAALEAKIAEANKKAEAESDWYICSELPDGRLQYTQDNADEHAVQLFTRPPIMSERELALLAVIEQMREALNDLIGVCITQVGADYNDTIHAAYKKGKQALVLTPDMATLKKKC